MQVLRGPATVPVILCGVICGGPWGLLMLTALGFNAATVTGSVPGIVLQLILIPMIVFVVQKKQK